MPVNHVYFFLRNLLYLIVQGCLLLGAEDIVQPRQTDLPIEHLEHGVGIHPAAFAAADVVDVAPEGFVQRAVMEE